MSMSSFITKEKGKKGHISVFDPHRQRAPFIISSTCLVWSSCWYRLYNSISSSGIGTELPAKVYSRINPVLIVGNTDQTQSTLFKAFAHVLVRKGFVGSSPEKFSRWKFSGTERFTKKFHFSLISLAASKKKVSGSCTHNFDATDLPNS